MDPDAALRETLEALHDLRRAHINASPDEFEAATGEERARAVDCLRTLADGLEKDGFPPDVREAIEDAGFELVADESPEDASRRAQFGP